MRNRGIVVWIEMLNYDRFSSVNLNYRIACFKMLFGMNAKNVCCMLLKIGIWNGVIWLFWVQIELNCKVSRSIFLIAYEWNWKWHLNVYLNSIVWFPLFSIFKWPYYRMGNILHLVRVNGYRKRGLNCSKMGKDMNLWRNCGSQ